MNYAVCSTIQQSHTCIAKHQHLFIQLPSYSITLHMWALLSAATSTTAVAAAATAETTAATD